MGVMFAGIAVAILIAIGAGFVMGSQSEPSWQVYKTVNVRVGDPGSNLVGPNWTGENAPGAGAEKEKPS